MSGAGTCSSSGLRRVLNAASPLTSHRISRVPEGAKDDPKDRATAADEEFRFLATVFANGRNQRFRITATEKRVDLKHEGNEPVGLAFLARSLNWDPENSSTEARCS